MRTDNKKQKRKQKEYKRLHIRKQSTDDLPKTDAYDTTTAID